MDATDAAVLKILGERAEWWVDELSPSIGADELRCLDALGCVEAHHPLWGYQKEASHGWASPMKMPSKWEGWPGLLRERRINGAGMAARVRLSETGRMELARLRRGLVAPPTGTHANSATSNDGPASPALTENQSRVLQTMAVFDAALLVSAETIAAEMDSAVRLSPRTIGPIVLKLIGLNLAERPEGERSGARLNLAGRRFASKIAD